MNVAKSVTKGRESNLVFVKGLKMLDGSYVKPGSVIQRVVLPNKKVAVLTIVCVPRKPHRQPTETRIYTLSRQSYKNLTAPNNIYTQEVV